MLLRRLPRAPAARLARLDNAVGDAAHRHPHRAEQARAAPPPAGGPAVTRRQQIDAIVADAAAARGVTVKGMRSRLSHAEYVMARKDAARALFATLTGI